MTPEINAGVLLGLMVATSLWFIYRSFVSISAMIIYRKNYKNSPHGLLYSEEDLCKTRHNWSLGIKLAIAQLPYGPYTVCRDCGLIQGTEYRLNQPGIDSLNESLKLRSEKSQEEKKVNLRLEFDLETLRDRWIDSNVKNIFELCEKGNEEALIYNLEYFFKYALESQQEVTEKLQAELDHQAELEITYRKLGIWKDDK